MPNPDPIKVYLQNMDSSRINNSSGSLVKRLHSIDVPTLHINAQPIENLDTDIVQRMNPVLELINEGQHELETLQKIENSPMYRVLHSLYQSAMSFFGKAKPQRDIYQLFTDQQNNVAGLNHILKEVVLASEKGLEITHQNLDGLIQQAKQTSTEAKQLDTSVPCTLDQYQALNSEMNELNREDAPETFYDSLGKLVAKKRNLRKEKFQYVVANESKIHFEKELEQFMLQEELFETALYRIMEMQMKTKLYQDALNRNIPIMRRIGTLSKAAVQLEGGVQILSEYNRQMNESYVTAIQEIHRVSNSQTIHGQFDSTTSQLRSLSENVQRRGYEHSRHLE